MLYQLFLEMLLVFPFFDDKYVKLKDSIAANIYANEFLREEGFNKAKKVRRLRKLLFISSFKI